MSNYTYKITTSKGETVEGRKYFRAIMTRDEVKTAIAWPYEGAVFFEELIKG